MLKKALIWACAGVLVTAMAWAAGPKTYQVTGPVLEIKADSIVVQKGQEKWEVGRDAAVKVTGDLQVGSKVTIEYTMKAATITVKDAKKPDTKKADGKKSK